MAYARLVPLWQAPDEPAHYNYIRHLAEGRGLPVLQPGDYDQAYLSRLTSERFPPTLPVDALRYESHQPPLYYLLLNPVHLAAGDAPLPTRVVLLRLSTALLGLPLLALAYGAARLVAPALALPAVAFVALLPQHLATLASVNNDVLGEMGVTAVLYAALRIARTRSRSSVAMLAVLGALAGVVLLAKSTAYMALALLPLALFLGARRVLPVGQASVPASPARAGTPAPPQKSFAGTAVPLAGSGRVVGPFLRERVARSAIRTVVMSLLALAVSGWWFARNMIEYGWTDPTGQGRHDLVVAGQPAYAGFGWEAASSFLTVTFRSFWAQIGWMAVPADERTYALLALVSGAAALGLAVYAWRAARGSAVEVRASGRGLGLLGLTLALVAGALVAYNLRFIQPQGRYLFPALLPLALFFALGLSGWVGQRLAPWLALPLVAGLGLFNLQVLTGMVPLLR